MPPSYPCVEEQWQLRKFQWHSTRPNCQWYSSWPHGIRNLQSDKITYANSNCAKCNNSDATAPNARTNAYDIRIHDSIGLQNVPYDMAMPCPRSSHLPPFVKLVRVASWKKNKSHRDIKGILSYGSLSSFQDLGWRTATQLDNGNMKNVIDLVEGKFINQNQHFFRLFSTLYILIYFYDKIKGFLSYFRENLNFCEFD